MLRHDMHSLQCQFRVSGGWDRPNAMPDIAACAAGPEPKPTRQNCPEPANQFKFESVPKAGRVHYYRLVGLQAVFLTSVICVCALRDCALLAASALTFMVRRFLKSVMDKGIRFPGITVYRKSFQSRTLVGVQLV